MSCYFNLTRKTIDRKSLIKLCVSNHKLLIETGRYNQTPLKVITKVKFRRICMELSEHNWASISKTVCPTCQFLTNRHLGWFSEYPDEFHNFTNLMFMTSSLQYSIMHNYANVQTINQSKSLPGSRVLTSLDGINGQSIQTLLRGENDSKQSDEIQATKNMRLFRMQSSTILQSLSSNR